MMSGCGILTNGKGTRREYCEFSLDELQVSVGHSLGHSPGESWYAASLPGHCSLLCDLEQGPVSFV